MTPRFFTMLLTVAIPLIVVLWICNFVVVPRLYPNLDQSGMPTTRPISGPGVFGDMFGAANSLFSGTTLILLIITLKLQADAQKRESASQREDRQSQEQTAKEQREDRLALAQLLKETALIQSRIADSMALQSAMFAAKNRREQLAILVKIKEERIKRSGEPAPQGLTLPNDPTGEKSQAEYNRLDAEIKQHNSELMAIEP